MLSSTMLPSIMLSPIDVFSALRPAFLVYALAMHSPGFAHPPAQDRVQQATDAASLSASEQSPLTRYVNGRWWTGQRYDRAPRCVRAEAFVRCPANVADRIVNLAGRYLIPPLADAHNHVTSDAPRAIAAGVFYLMNPTSLASLIAPPERRKPAPGKVDVVYSMGAVTAPGGHPLELYEDQLGPRFYKDKKPADFVGDAYHFVSAAADIAPVLDRLVDQHADFVKIVLEYSEQYARRRDDPAFRGLRGLDPALVPELVRQAHRRGLRVAAHIETAADFRVIVAAGVDEAAHMPGYLGPFGGVTTIATYLITDADARAAARSGIRVVATASLALGNPDKAKLAAIQAMQRANLRKLKRAGVPILIGTDGYTDAAIAEARYLVALGVLTQPEALNALTQATPRFIFPARKIGKLEPGYEASFLTLDADPARDLAVLPKAIVGRTKQGMELSPPTQ